MLTIALPRPLRPRERQPPGLERVDHARGGEDEERRVGVGDEEAGDEVLVLGRHAGGALAAAALGAVLGQLRPLDVAALGDGDDHVLALDQVLVVEVALPLDDLGAARHGEELLHLAELVGDDRHDPRVRAQDVEEVGDPAGELLELVGDLLDPERGQPLQPEVEDGAGLGLREQIGAVLAHPVRGVVDQRDVGGDVGGRPRPGHQPLARLGRVGGGADRRHHLVDVRDRDGEAAEDVGALAGLPELVRGAAGDHLLAEGDEGCQELPQVELLGPAAVQRQHVAAEALLQVGGVVELVQHHLGRRVAAELDDDTHPEAVALVLDVGDALDPLVAGELGDALDQRRLVHLVGDLGDDDRGASAAHLLDPGPGADQAPSRGPRDRPCARRSGRGSAPRSGSRGRG